MLQEAKAPKRHTFYGAQKETDGSM